MFDESKMHTLDTLNDSIIEHDASTSVESIKILEHEIIENESCIVVKNEHDFCSTELHDFASAPMKDSPGIDDDVVVERGFFKQILSCDLPPDISCEASTCFSNITPSLSTLSCTCVSGVSCPNLELDFTISDTHALECFKNGDIYCTFNDVCMIDFLGCDTYLNKSLPFLEFGTAAFVEFFLKEPKHITPRKEHMGERVYVKTYMFLIRDENFSHKSLKRFKHQVVPFLYSFILHCIFCWLDILI